MKILFLIVLIVLIDSQLSSASKKLKVQGTKLYNNGSPVFLSGTNVAWSSYGSDFGMGKVYYNKVNGITNRDNYRNAINGMANNGGNTIRVWVHIAGQHSPHFDGNGKADGADTQALIDDLGDLLDYAANKKVFVILCLWNLADKPKEPENIEINKRMVNMYTNPGYLDAYINKVLKPLVIGLKNKPALAAYDIINEPAGGVKGGQYDSNSCYNTKAQANSGLNWAHWYLNMKDVLRFINIHADAIKYNDPDALVTVGDNVYMTSAYSSSCTDCNIFYSDQCLFEAGGKKSGTLDFYQVHSYADQKQNNGKPYWVYPNNSPLKRKSSDFKLNKPLLVGEFSTACSESQWAVKNYQLIYDNGYCGALNWQYNGQGNKTSCPDHPDETWQAEQGVKAIKDQTKNGKTSIQL